MIASLRDDLPQWRLIRTLAAPRGMVEAATAARLAGDWRAAAAAARVDIEFDLDAVRNDFGAESAAAIADDLRHFAPDLLWWHLPRHRAGLTTVLARQNVILAPRAGTGPLLWVRTPLAPFGPQRLSLRIGTVKDLEYERWFVMPRHTWDVRHCGELAQAWGYGTSDAVSAYLAAAEYAEAWRTCGIELDAEDPVQPRPALPTSPVGVAREAREVARLFGTDTVGTMGNASLLLMMGDTITAALAEHEDLYGRPSILVQPVPADLALLDAGWISPDDLHPLVRNALPGLPATAPVRPPVTAPGAVRVRCRGTWHELSIEGGALRLHEHDDEEIERESVLRSLGGASSGCFAARQAWLTGAGRLPKALAARRREVRERLLAGDTGWLLDGLAAGTVDPLMRDGSGWSLLHLAMLVDYDRLLPILDRCDLPVDVQDRVGRTPLYLAVMGGAPRDLLVRLLERGADPLVETVHGADSFTAAYRGHRWVRELLDSAQRSG